QDITQVDESTQDNLLEAPTQRRDFLKFLGFSTLAATVAASCEMPVRYAIPYAIKPAAEKITPGIANYYASTYIDNGDAISVVVKTKEGRPILVEGNDLSQLYKGAVNSRVVASTLGLYDTARLRGPMINNDNVDLMSDIDTQIMQQLSSVSGQIVILTGTINSPTTLESINRFIAKYPQAKHIQYDPVSYSGMILANANDFGKKAIPAYRFDLAQTIFSIGADFLGAWLNPAQFTQQYVKNRKLKSAQYVMSKHYQVEALMTTTGASADERATCKPSEYGVVALALYKAITNGTKPNLGSDKLNNLITKAAEDLKSTKGLVVCGSNDPNVQSVINAINSAINAYGNTIDFSSTLNVRKGIDTDMVQLVNDMNAGAVGALILHGVNPSYEYF